MESLRRFSLVDRVLGCACRALATLSDAVPARRPVPGASIGSQLADEVELTEPERKLSGALMRVNHVGEICAQALYEGQAASTSDPALREYFLGAAREEADAMFDYHLEQIARALAANPRFLLLDEPFAGVDPISVIDIQRIVRELSARNIGVLITDHNVRETLGVCQRSYIIGDGVVIASGSAEEILANPRVREVYLGESFRL